MVAPRQRKVRTGTQQQNNGTGTGRLWFIDTGIVQRYGIGYSTGTKAMYTVQIPDPTDRSEYSYRYRIRYTVVVHGQRQRPAAAGNEL